MPTVTVYYHAYLREKLGMNSELLAFSSDAITAGGVLSAFVAAHPEFDRLSQALNVAVDDEILSRNSAIQDGARVDLLPPYGGG